MFEKTKLVIIRVNTGQKGKFIQFYMINREKNGRLSLNTAFYHYICIA